MSPVHISQKLNFLSFLIARRDLWSSLIFWIAIPVSRFISVFEILLSLLSVMFMMISLSLFLCVLSLSYHNEYNESLKSPSQLSRRFKTFLLLEYFVSAWLVCCSSLSRFAQCKQKRLLRRVVNYFIMCVSGLTAKSATLMKAIQTHDYLIGFNTKHPSYKLVGKINICYW